MHCVLLAARFPDHEANGSPDWVTDLGWDAISASTGAGDITTTGGVHRGFARSMRYSLPTAFACFETIAQLRGGAAPTNIYVTGHSLGGGLAQHFASAVLLGDEYDVEHMPASVRALALATTSSSSRSAHRARGDYTWAYALSKEALDSDFYDPSPIETVDADARLVVDPSIAKRVLDASRPAAFRVLISTIRSRQRSSAATVHMLGKPSTRTARSFIDWIGVVDSADHEPERVRKLMTDAMADSRTPDIAWRYEALDVLVPDRNDGRNGHAKRNEQARGWAARASTPIATSTSTMPRSRATSICSSRSSAAMRPSSADSSSRTDSPSSRAACPRWPRDSNSRPNRCSESSRRNRSASLPSRVENPTTGIVMPSVNPDDAV